MSLEEVTNVGANAANLPASHNEYEQVATWIVRLLVNIYFDIYHLFLPTPDDGYISHARHWSMQHQDGVKKCTSQIGCPAARAPVAAAADWVTRQYVHVDTLGDYQIHLEHSLSAIFLLSALSCAHVTYLATSGDRFVPQPHRHRRQCLSDPPTLSSPIDLLHIPHGPSIYSTHQPSSTDRQRMSYKQTPCQPCISPKTLTSLWSLSLHASTSRILTLPPTYSSHRIAHVNGV
jgi:hypothetical protein